MSKLVLNPSTLASINKFIEKPSQPLLLVGYGLDNDTEIVDYIAQKLLGPVIGQAKNNPNVIFVQKDPKTGKVTIDSVRQLKNQIKLKSTNSGLIKRLVVIAGAHELNAETQNALLKSLEEPSVGTLFLLTTEDYSKLLSTITSRCARINVLPIGINQAVEEFGAYPREKVIASWHLADGNPDLIAELLSDTGSKLSHDIELSKAVLRMDKYSRIIEFDKLASDKKQLLAVLSGLQKISRALLVKAIESNNTPQTAKLAKDSHLLLNCQKLLISNVSPRLVALRAAINLKI